MDKLNEALTAVVDAQKAFDAASGVAHEAQLALEAAQATAQTVYADYQTYVTSILPNANRSPRVV